LFTIDRRPFETALAQTEAGLAQAKANLAFAESDLARAQGVAIGTVITKQTFDQRTQVKRVAEAAVIVQEAVVRQAALDLEFTELRAPVSGRIGDRRVSIGNLVTGGTAGNTSLLATIESIDPIRFEYTLDEGSYRRYVHLSEGRADAANRGLTTPVKLKLIDEPTFSHEGKLDFIDNAISRSSSTIRARAVFANPNGEFTTGMFARVQMAAAPARDSLLVPEAAIGAEQVRKFVLVVDAENVARPKYVTLGPVVDGLRVITQGLTPDDNVIINGLMRARPGAKVTPHQSSTASALITRPPIVLYDSPTAGLDPVTSQTIIALILRLRDIYGVTALLATHRLQDGFALANFHFDIATNRVLPNSHKPRGRESDGGESSTRFAVLRDGKVFFEGTPEELQAVKDPYLKRFLV